MNQVKFTISNQCSKHGAPFDYVCTMPECANIDMCEACFEKHRQNHPTGFIYKKSDWIKKINSDTDELYKFTKKFNTKDAKNFSTSITLSKSLNGNSQNLASLVEKLMKCITEERRVYTQGVNDKINKLNEEVLPNIEAKKKSLKYFESIQNSKAIDYVFLLLS